MISSVALYLCIGVCMSVYFLCRYARFMAFLRCYVVDIFMSVCLFGVVAYTLWLCGKFIVVRIRTKLGNRARCDGRVVCMARKNTI